jgi:hypothetical protein
LALFAASKESEFGESDYILDMRVPA